MVQWRLFAFICDFTFKMHPIVYLLGWNNMSWFSAQNGIYAAYLAGNQGADRRHGMLDCLFGITWIVIIILRHLSNNCILFCLGLSVDKKQTVYNCLNFIRIEYFAYSSDELITCRSSVGSHARLTPWFYAAGAAIAEHLSRKKQGASRSASSKRGDHIQCTRTIIFTKNRWYTTVFIEPGV